TAHMPLFGVGLGMQMMGLAFNAPFIQDLDLAQDHVKGARHLITAEPGTHLATVIGRQAVEVASFHHQGLASPGEELTAAAFADDGTLEAVELPDADWALGVQWHPEKIPDSPTTRALFSSFVEAARAYRMQRA
ncbi:MAG: gamma-glutamyl-gamma-aminobutyrate hydrolase family protein, partial [Planctomycetes bacterium]|nr:gamma-glutamyl-gamma-aminobutyrate hydrolase family protein [Planctomycetota bacterium]